MEKQRRGVCTLIFESPNPPPPFSPISNKLISKPQNHFSPKTFSYKPTHP